MRIPLGVAFNHDCTVIDTETVMSDHPGPLLTQRTPSSALGFLDLPAEVRQYVYQHLIPENRGVAWYVTPIEGRVNVATELHAVLPQNDRVLYRTSLALLRSCRTVYQDLFPLLYGSYDFVFTDMENFLHLQPLIGQRAISLVPKVYLWLSSLVEGYSGRNEKAQKAVLTAFASSMVGLKEVMLRVEAGADDEAKGTRFKPQALRKLLCILKNSPCLKKVFAFDADYTMADVRVTTADGKAAYNEVELDVDGEYQKWLDKLRARRERRKVVEL